MEESLGVLLVERGQRFMGLTAEGCALISSAMSTRSNRVQDVCVQFMLQPE